MTDGSPSGVRTFLTIGVGAFVLLVACNLGAFVFGLWVYEQNRSTTQFVLLTIASTVPTIALAPLVGVLVDRLGTRRALFFGSVGGALCSSAVAAIVLSGHLAVWNLALAFVARAVFLAFQTVAFPAARAQLVPREQLGRASGLVLFTQAIAQLLAPLVGGALSTRVPLVVWPLAEVVGFACNAILVRGTSGFGGGRVGTGEPILAEAVIGWKYITARPGLVALVVFFSISNMVQRLVAVLATPLVLSFGTPANVGFVQGTAGIGMIVGGTLMAAWGGPKRRIRGVIVVSLAGSLLVMSAGLRASVPFIATAAFLYHLGRPIVLGSSETIWQSRVDLSVLGRVYAVRQMLELALVPVAFLGGGVLADKVCEPLLAVGGPLAPTVGRVIGVGPGRGIALLFLVFGAFNLVCTVAAGSSRHFLNLDEPEPSPSFGEDGLWPRDRERD